MNRLLKVLILSAGFAAVFILCRTHKLPRKLVRMVAPTVKLGDYRDPVLNEVRDFQTEMTKHLVAGDFEKLDQVAADLRASKDRFDHGGWKLFAFYNAFDLPKEMAEHEWLARQQQLAAWLKARPTSGPAHIALAEFYTSYAWRARGSGYVNTVTQQGWSLFRDRLGLAYRTLEVGAPHASQDPHYWRALQTIARGQNWPDARRQEVYARGIAIEPEYFSLYLERAVSLLPRWGGPPGAMEKFALEATQVPGGPGVEIYARIAETMDGYHRALFDETKLEWLRVRDGITALNERYRDEPTLLSLGAMLACRVGENTLAKELFEELGDRVDLRTWGSTEQFRRHAERVKAPIPGDPASK